MELSSSYGMTGRRTDENLAKFLSKFAPDTQVVYTCDVTMCIMGDSLTLSQIDKEFGKNASSLWLVPQLTDLSEFCNVQNSLSEKHIITLAQLIVAEYHYLKVSELMLFFRNVKTGNYGKFYGAVSPIDIMVALRQFIKERNLIIEKAETIKREKALEEWSKGTVTYEEYIESKLLTNKDGGNNNEESKY